MNTTLGANIQGMVFYIHIIVNNMINGCALKLLKSRAEKSFQGVSRGYSTRATTWSKDQKLPNFTAHLRCFKYRVNRFTCP